MTKYNHSEVFAEIKTINEDIKVNLTSLQYLQILDYYLHNSLRYLVQISKRFFDNYLAKVVSYQQIHAMSKLSSESREKLCCAYFNYLTTDDPQWITKLYLNRGLWLGIISHWLHKSKEYFECRSPFKPHNKRDSKRQDEIAEDLSIANRDMYFAYFKAIEYWFNKALDFKSKIMQKYTRMTLLQAQKAYVDYNHVMELDDVTQIYLQVMSRAIDRCDSRFGVLTTFIQSWLKSAKAIVQKSVSERIQSSSYESMLDEFGDCMSFGATHFESQYEGLQEISLLASKCDPTGCLRIKYHIPQYLEVGDRDLLMVYAQ